METNKIVNGKREGLWKEYYYYEILLYEGHYKEGNRDGLWKYYHVNGNLWFEGHYRNDREEGLWKEYDQKGVLIKREVYLL